MSKSLRVLLIDDSPDDALLEVLHLQRHGYDVTWERVETADALRAALSTKSWDVALCDYAIPALGGPGALRILRTEAPNLPAITISGQVGEEYAVEVMRAGARDYVRKDNLARLVPAIEREVAEASRARQLGQVEAALKATEGRFRTIFDEAPLGIALIDSLTGRICEPNPRYAAIVGRSQAELASIDWKAITHPDDIQADLDNLARLNAGTIQGFKINKRYLRPDGSWVWVQMTVARISEGETDQPRHLCMVEDVTERIQHEERLREQVTLLNVVPDAVLMMDHTGAITHWNAAAEQVLGYRPEEALGKDLHDLLAPQRYRDAYRATFPEFQRSGRGNAIGKTRELAAVHKDGSEIPISLSLAALFRQGAWHAVGVIRDITELKAAETRLRESEERYRSILNASPDDITITDLKGRVLGASPAALRMFGYGREEDLLGRDALEFIVSEDRERASASLGRMLSRIRMGPEEYRGLRADGSTFEIEVNAQFIRGTDLRRQGIVLVIRDISARKRAERALEESERRFRTYYDLGLIGMAITSPTKGWIQCNEYLCSLLGYTFEELAAKTWAELTHPEDVSRDEEQFNRVLTGEIDGYTLDKRFLRKDGSTVWTAVSAKCLRNPDGTVAYFVAIAQDLTARRQAEAAVMEGEATFAQLFHNSPVAMALNSVDDWIYRDVNRSFERDAGFDRDEVIGRTSRDLGLFVDPEAGARLIDEVRQQGSVYGKSCAIRTKQGVIRQSLVCAGAILRGNQTYVLSTILDVTERELAVTALRELSQTLEERVAERIAALVDANAALESFSYSVSHDLRVPLRHIQGFAQLLAEDVGSQLPEQQRQYLARLSEAGERMNQMITAMLRLSRAGREGLDVQRLDLTEIAKASFADLQALAPGRDVAFVVESLPQVHGDPTLVRELFDNLLSNALKFTRPVAAPRVEVGVKQLGNTTAFYVRDNGVGFDPQKAHRLFGVFQRLHSPDEFQGIGVGLSVVKRIVEKHAGRVWAESAPGAGATFYFTLPMADPDPGSR